MGTFFYIIVNIVLPIFILITIGYVAQITLKMDVRTFTRTNMYVFVPAILFVKVYETTITMKLFYTIILYMFIISITMYFVGEGIARLFHYPQGRRKAFINSIIFFNGGNYGLPLIQLAFNNNPLATTSQIFIMMIQTIMQNTLGVFQASTGSKNSRQALLNVLIMPSLYVLCLVIILKTYHIVVPKAVMMPVINIADGFVAFALITLGVQLAEVKGVFRFKEVLISSYMRLIIAPILGTIIVYLIGVEGILAKALVLAVATPSAVNTAIIAKEFDNEPEYASQIVFMSTLLSAITISGIIFLLNCI